MQTSKPYKIFGYGRGIDISQQQNQNNQQYPQGRNVQPFPSTKKFEQQTAEKPIQSPFDGYSSTVSSDNNLAYS